MFHPTQSCLLHAQPMHSNHQAYPVLTRTYLLHLRFKTICILPIPVSHSHSSPNTSSNTHTPQHPLTRLTTHPTPHPTLVILNSLSPLTRHLIRHSQYPTPCQRLLLTLSPLVAGGTNLALHKPVKSSSQWGSRGGPNTLTDGQVPPNKKWDYNKCLCTRKDSDGPWVSGERMRINIFCCWIR